MAKAITEHRVQASWAVGQPVSAAWMSSSCPLVAETLARSGHHAVIVDMQHSQTVLEQVYHLIRAIEVGGTEPFVRVSSLDPTLIGQVLDGGATGIIVPLINSVAEAEELGAAVRYAPHGTRSVGARRPLLRHGLSYVEKARSTFVVLAMIETRSALEALEPILGVNGIDGVFIGPADLRQSLTDGDEPGSEQAFEAAVTRIRTLAKAAGKIAGIFAKDLKTTRGRLREGFDLVSTPTDLTIIAENSAAALAAVRACPERGNGSAA